MCLIVFAYKMHPKYKLIFAANRDEFYDRPSKEAHFWDDYPSLLAGKDLLAGGTWMGITKQGKLAAITNYRGPGELKNDPPSRGHLITSFLTNNKTATGYYSEIEKSLKEYNGFNLIYGEIDDLYHCSNKAEHFQRINKGIYGISNALLDTPWPKVEKSKYRLKNLLEQGTIIQEELLNLLSDTTTANDEELPETGISLELEKMLSAVFTKSGKYGTRCSTAVMIDNDNNVNFAEKTFENKKGSFSLKEFKFKITN